MLIHDWEPFKAAIAAYWVGVFVHEKELIFNDQITQYQRKLKIDLADEVGADLSDKEIIKDKINKDRDVYNPYEN